jgi:hypothetical protein
MTFKQKQEKLNDDIKKVNKKYSFDQHVTAFADDMLKLLDVCYPINPNQKNINLENLKVISIFKYKQEILKTYLLFEKSKSKPDIDFIKFYLEKNLDKVLTVLNELVKNTTKFISIKIVRKLINDKSKFINDKYAGLIKLDRREYIPTNSYVEKIQKSLQEPGRKNWIRYDGRTN